MKKFNRFVRRNSEEETVCLNRPSTVDPLDRIISKVRTVKVTEKNRFKGKLNGKDFSKKTAQSRRRTK